MSFEWRPALYLMVPGSAHGTKGLSGRGNRGKPKPPRKLPPPEQPKTVSKHHPNHPASVFNSTAPQGTTHGSSRPKTGHSSSKNAKNTTTRSLPSPLLNSTTISPLIKVLQLEVSGHRRQCHSDAVQLFSHLYLAAQPRRFRKAKSQIQHIIFIIVRLRNLIVKVRINDNMACRTSTRAATSSLHIKPMSLSYIQDIIALGNLKRLLPPVLRDKRNMKLFSRVRFMDMPMESRHRRGEGTDRWSSNTREAGSSCKAVSPSRHGRWRRPDKSKHGLWDVDVGVTQMRKFSTYES